MKANATRATRKVARCFSYFIKIKLPIR